MIFAMVLRSGLRYPASKHTVAALPDLVAYFRFTHAAGSEPARPGRDKRLAAGQECTFSKTLLFEK